MRALPATLGLPDDAEILIAMTQSLEGREQLAVPLGKVVALRNFLGWIRTSPMPYDEFVVASNIAEACDAASAILDSAIGAQLGGDDSSPKLDEASDR